MAHQNQKNIDEMTVEEFRAEMARLFRIALDQYDGDEAKAQQAVNRYNQGLLQRDMIRQRTAA